jgi:hypothetical protein
MKTVKPLLRGLGLLAITSLPACKYTIVPYVKEVTLRTVVPIRENANFTRLETVNLADLAEAKADFPGNATIDDIVITSLAVDLTVLPTTNAASLDFTLGIADAAGVQSPISREATIGTFFTDVATTIALLPDEAKAGELNKLRSELNQFLHSDAQTTMKIGFFGRPTGGRVDIDLTAVVELRVVARVCEKTPGNMLIESALAPCDLGSSTRVVRK